MASFTVELRLSLRNVQFGPSTSGVRVSIQTQHSSDNFVEISQTETVFDSFNAEFKHSCSVRYQFDKLQRLKFIVYGVKDESGIFTEKLGECLCDLSVAVSNRCQLSLPLSSSSSLLLSVSIPQFYSQYISLQFYGHHLHSPTSHPLAAYFVLTLQAAPELSFALHRSEIIKDEKNPYWAEFKVPLFVLQDFNESFIEITCYNFNNNASDSFIGKCRTTLSQLQKGAGNMNHYMLLDSKGVHIHEKTSVMLRRCELTTGSSFFDLVNNGIHLHLTEAIDMTASNGNPTSEDSLHYIHPHQPSAYLRSILSVTPPLLAYLSNSRIAALGFGAKVGNDFRLSQCFYLNGSPTDAHVEGLTGLLNAYRTSRMSLQPFAPTEFADVIYYVSTLAKAEVRRHIGLYFCLLILTDGAPSNNKRTIDAIVDSSYFPMSTIALGVGKKKAIAGMDVLLSPTLKHSDGRPLCRQNFMFVHSDDLEKENALSLLPLQMVQWSNRFTST